MTNKTPVHVDDLDQEGFNLLDRWSNKLEENDKSISAVFIDGLDHYLPHNWREMAFEELGELGA